MRTLFFIELLFMVTFMCAQNKEATIKTEVQLEQNQDSTEYELIISDNNFDTWYLLNYSEAKDHSNEYYRNKNIIASISWDEYYRNGKYEGVVDSYLNYQPQIDYGIELNRKLFWYFKFVEEVHHVPLF